jgi:hypothetical protein
MNQQGTTQCVATEDNRLNEDASVNEVAEIPRYPDNTAPS